MTHNAKVLRLLSDGKPHSHHELYGLYGLHVIAHSRVSDLRRMGHFIEQWHEDDQYWYQLVSGMVRGPEVAGSDGDPLGAQAHGPSPSTSESSPASSAAGRGRDAGRGRVDSLPEHGPARQLTVFEGMAA